MVVSFDLRGGPIWIADSIRDHSINSDTSQAMPQQQQTVGAGTEFYCGRSWVSSASYFQGTSALRTVIHVYTLARRYQLLAQSVYEILVPKELLSDDIRGHGAGSDFCQSSVASFARVFVF